MYMCTCSFEAWLFLYGLPGLSDAGKLVIHCLGYTGTGHEDEGIGSIDKELSLSAIAVEPDDIIWLKVRLTVI